MNPRLLLPLVLVIALLAVISSCMFSVGEGELALRTEFGAILNADYSPGLHFKYPWPLDQVVRFDKRILTQSHPGETFLTNDNRALIVDFYIKWRVQDPKLYFESTGASESSAGERISDIVKDNLKSVVAQRTLQQIVTAERTALTDQMLAGAERNVAALGVRLIDVRVQRIDLPDEVAARVYQKMQQYFAKIANQLRSEGASSAMSIRAAVVRQQTEIVSNAQRDALRVQGAADAQATDIYARAYASNPEFYAFYRSLQAYRNSLGKDNDVFVLSPDSEFFRYMKDPAKSARH
ncbi:MAG TPA: protease modulator HflC [Steroidobacteraceae bacterium]|nr:protease modulator HflC [Steroidobacteraceae bacterium]